MTDSDTHSGRFAGKVAIVTGGAAGIGLATTRRLVAEGGRVVVGDLNEAALTAVAAELGDSVDAWPATSPSRRTSSAWRTPR